MSGCHTSMEKERRELVLALEKELTEQQAFIKIHAAEALIAHGHTRLAQEHIAPDLVEATIPYSLGVHRVLAQVATDETQRAAHIEAIRVTAWNTASSFQLHAIESLAKLRAYRLEDRAAAEAYLAKSDDASSVFAKWLLALSGNSADLDRLVETLDSEDSLARFRGGYALARFDSLPEGIRRRLQVFVETEPLDSPARVFALSAFLKHHPTGATPEHVRELEKYLHSDVGHEALEAGRTLGQLGEMSLLPLLKRGLNSAEADGRIGAADGGLRLLRGQRRLMSNLDWWIIVAFLVAMLLIGIYYSLQPQSRDEYLLGGRAMKPWAVGLSYFATMFSTITYLSWPGEIIRHGPMMLAQLLGFPLAVVLVHFLIIPHFMGLRVTSAYEILELRLGLSIRMLGSCLFLLMRLFWMAVIVHTTTVEILVPVAGFHPKFAPYLAMAVCFGTIVYTALGGFRAVVVTDVAQTLILFGATIAAMLTISLHFGGLGWLPTRWEPQWQHPVFFYDPSVRITFVSAVIAATTWQVCTAGSDQMAIQRYLATRDVKAARRMYAIALFTNGVVCLSLAALGLSLYAYFHMRPEMLNHGQDIASDSDQFFQQFIAVAMPPGICGLVVAGLLSAAMDSLSSGINSSCSVITVDFFERFRQPSDSQTSRLARWVSWGIGVSVVGLSTVVSMVSGNLLEVSYKVVNLLTAPLFGIFFMALFVRWATPFGTWVGAAAGIAAVVAINYWKELTGETGIGFIWAMPFSLVVQIVTGCFASWIPIGPRARPMLPRGLVSPPPIPSRI